MAKIYVSYARADREFVLRLSGELRNDGHEVWVPRGVKRLESALADNVSALHP